MLSGTGTHPARASGVLSAAGRPGRKTAGCVHAVIRGTRLIPGAFALLVFINGLKPSAFPVADGRRIRIGTQSNRTMLISAQYTNGVARFDGSSVTALYGSGKRCSVSGAETQFIAYSDWCVASQSASAHPPREPRIASLKAFLWRSDRERRPFRRNLACATSPPSRIS
jgi:hypothetical protein